MSNFLDIIFPENLSYGSKSLISFSTQVAQALSGKESRFLRQANALTKYVISEGIRSKEEIEQLLTFFRIVKGKYYSFRFKDIFDSEAFLTPIKVLSPLSFQLQKQYSLAEEVLFRKITKPRDGSIILKYEDNIISQNLYTINYATGSGEFYPTVLTSINNFNIINVKATFQFDVEVRFDIDFLPVKVSNLECNVVEEILLCEVI